MYPVKLKEWRQYKAITQTELAERARVARSTIELLEKPGGKHSARPSTRRRLAEALGIGVHELVTVPPHMAKHEQGE